MVKQVNLPKYPQLPFIFTPETAVKKTIVVYGDSFADAANTYKIGMGLDPPVNNTVNSWMWFLATFLQAKVVTYGVSAGSVQLCYELFKRTLDEPRDATIIYHTEERRSDKTGLDLPRLSHANYVDWDEHINDSTVHLYWDNEKPIYKFKQGTSFHTKYHLTHCVDTTARFANDKDYHFDESLKHMSSNHVTQPGNLLLAIRLTQYFKTTLNWETIF